MLNYGTARDFRHQFVKTRPFAAAGGNDDCG
jgi:hypothetical protein